MTHEEFIKQLKDIPNLTDDILIFILDNYFIKAGEWCKGKNKRFNSWHKEKAKEHLYSELEKHFKKW